MFRKSLISLIATGLVFMPVAPTIYASDSFDSDAIEVTDVPLNMESSASKTPEVILSESSIENVAEESVSYLDDPSTSIEENEQSNTTEETLESFSTTETASSTEETEYPTEEEEKSLLELKSAKVMVDNWSDFVKYFNDSSVTQITLTKNIVKGTQKLNARLDSLEINGNDQELDLGDTTLTFGSTNNEATFKIHNFKRIVSKKTLIESSVTNSLKWRFVVGNLTVPSGNKLLDAPGSEVFLFGNLNIATTNENFAIGSAIFENSTNYTGTSSQGNASLFKYPIDGNITSNATGGLREFRTGRNSKISLSNPTKASGDTSAIYDFKTLLVEEGSLLDIKMQGTSLKMEKVDSSVRIKTGGNLNLTSNGSTLPISAAIHLKGNEAQKITVDSGGALSAYQTNSEGTSPLLWYEGSNSTVEVNPGGFINLVGNSNEILSDIQLSMISSAPSTKNNYLTFDTPAYFNLQSIDPSSQATAIKPFISDLEFKVLNTGVSVWELGEDNTKPSGKIFDIVQSFRLTDGFPDTKDKIEIIYPNKPSEAFNASYNRISGVGNINPMIEWETITDANQKASVRVAIGYTVGENSFDPFEKIYASDQNPALVDFYDEQDNLLEADVPTDSDGYATYSHNQFLKSGTKIKAVAKLSDKTSDKTATTVIDVTPPEPAVVNGGIEQAPTINKLSGTGEIGSVVTLERNGVPVAIPETIVDSDGKWKIDLSNVPLERLDQLQVFLQDNAGSLVGKVSEVPETNNERGNINPKEEKVTYKDAEFEIGTIVKIVGELIFKEVPTVIDFGQQVVKAEEQTFTPETVIGQLIISDTRGTNATWRLLLSEKTPLTVGERSLTDVFEYQQSDGTFIKINDAPEVIETGDTEQDGDFELSSNWNKQHGLIMKVPVQKQLLGAYEGVLNWELQDVPGNP